MLAFAFSLAVWIEDWSLWVQSLCACTRGTGSRRSRLGVAKVTNVLDALHDLDGEHKGRYRMIEVAALSTPLYKAYLIMPAEQLQD